MDRKLHWYKLLAFLTFYPVLSVWKYFSYKNYGVIITGANNHKYFMGFLYALLLMCSWMIYGGAHFYVARCNITMEDGNIWKFSCFFHFTHFFNIKNSFFYFNIKNASP